MTFEKVVVVDGRDHLLGRLAGTVAKELVLGQRVVVVRCEELEQSGPSWRNVIKVQKERVKKCNTNKALGNYNYRAPAAVFRRTVISMLPKKTLSSLAALNRLKCFEGIPAPYDKMKRKVVPDALRVIRLRPGRKSTNLGEMYSGLGWKHQALLKTLEEKRKVKSAAYYEKVKAARALRAKAAAEVSIPADAKAVLEKFGF